jgi:hypothetical protein
MPEHVASQLGDLALNSVKPVVNRGELTVYPGELTIHLAELAPEEVDELLVLA